MGGLESDSPCVEYFSGVSSSSADQEWFCYCILLKGKYETLAVHRLPLPRHRLLFKAVFQTETRKDCQLTVIHTFTVF